MTFVKGQSGNPAGRPKKERELARMLRGIIAAKGDDGITLRRTLLTQLATKAVEGDLEAIKIVLDRVDGRVPAPVEVSGPDGGDIRIKGYGTASPDDWPPADPDV